VGYRLTVWYGLFAKDEIRSDLNSNYSISITVIRTQIRLYLKMT